MQKPSVRRSTGSFKPSMNVLRKILFLLVQKPIIGRTELCLETRLNYSRVKRHMEWLEEKEFIELVVQNGKVRIRLTERGRRFAEMLLD